MSQPTFKGMGLTVWDASAGRLDPGRRLGTGRARVEERAYSEGVKGRSESGGSFEWMGMVNCGAVEWLVAKCDGSGCDEAVPSNFATSAFVRPTVLYGVRMAGAGATAPRSCFSDRSKGASGAGLVGAAGPVAEKREKNLFMLA